MINEYELDLTNLVDAILFAKEGIVHPKILTPEQIMSSIQHVQSLEPRLIFPTPLKTIYAEDLVRLSKVEIAFSEPNLIYVIAIPLLNDETFNLFHLLPVPVKQNYDNTSDKFAYIIPNHEYIAISLDRSTYFELSEQSLQRCKKSQNHYICNRHQPLFHSANHRSCEIDLFLENSIHDLSKCNVRLNAFDGSYWTDLISPNTWIYSVSAPETVHIVCPKNNVIRLELINSGTLTLNNQCTGHSKTVTLTTSNAISTSTTTRSYTPDFTLNLTNIYQDFTEGTSINFSALPIFHMYKPIHLDARDLATNGVALDDIIKQAKEISTHRRAEQRSSDIISDGLTYGGIALAIIGFMFLAYRFSLFSKILKLCICNRNRNTRHNAKPIELGKPIEIELQTPVADPNPQILHSRQLALPPPIPRQSPKLETISRIKQYY
ncbi:uncharacterized protein LOC125502194 [Athalia rosae]|uniref:uncharacterized protein LOC125502194 n=1 Tax=Athalia rosae TaxID=37344 RepID=UPI00203404AA|nr:uncharacterized protein LOC125502194 [Athalia rosae]